jgi:hypothetical protein
MNEMTTITPFMSMTVCVYRLRLAKLNEQMKEDSDMGKTDDTFQEVFREFSNMASNNPELLRRNMIHIDQSEQSVPTVILMNGVIVMCNGN